MNIEHHYTEHLAVDECLALLRRTMVGRIAVVIDEHPQIFPVNHVVDHGSIVFRTAKGSKLSAAVGQVVAYQADGYDDALAAAWSTMVVGRAAEIRDLHGVLDALDLPIHPLEPGIKPHIVRIEPLTITGRRFPVVDALALGGKW